MVLGGIIMLSIEKISSNHLDNRLVKKKHRLIVNIDAREIDSLIKAQNTFTDYDILKDEFVVLNKLKPDAKISPSNKFVSEQREIEGDIEIYRILNTAFIYNGNKYQLEIGETMTAVEGVKGTVRFYMFGVLILSLLVTLVTDYTFTNIILKPFYKIIDQKINKVNDPIAYSYEKIPTNTKDFRILDESVNGLMRKITDLFTIEKQFIANVSHELLTPISVLTGRLENILNAENLPEEHEEKLVASLKTLVRLKSIINSLLLISKIENAQYLKTDGIDLKEEILEIQTDLEDRIADKEIAFVNNIHKGFQFNGNQALIHTLLINIINNAIKYNKPNGKIELREVENINFYELTISDSGIGMDEIQQGRAFKRFERINTDRETGHGLGLAIVSSIAKFHGLILELTSEPQVGSTFKIKFPKS